MPSVDTNGMDNFIKEFQSALHSARKLLMNGSDAAYEMKKSAYTLDDYHGQKVEGSSRLEERITTSNTSLLPIKSYLLCWDNWNIIGQKEIIYQCDNFASQIDEIIYSLSLFHNESFKIETIAREIDQYIHQIEVELNGNISRDIPIHKLLKVLKRDQLYGTTDFGKIMKIPCYYQQNYSDVSLGYSDKNIETSGCGFTAVSMAVSYLLGQKITPKELVDDWSLPYYVYNQGMDNGFPAAAMKHYNLEEPIITYDKEKMVAYLKDGHPVLCGQTARESQRFTKGSHIILLNGVDEQGNIYVNDPNIENAIDKGYNKQGFTIDEIDEEMNCYFILGKKKK